jgi:putative heme-binding domain-containing protein
VGRRFDSRAILESILTPSKIIDPKYRYTAYVLTNGKVVVGQTMHVKADHIKARSNARSQQTMVVARDNIEESFPAEVSPMPPGLVDVLSQSRIYDLLVYLQAEGDPTHKAFQKE